MQVVLFVRLEPQRHVQPTPAKLGEAELSCEVFQGQTRQVACAPVDANLSLFIYYVVNIDGICWLDRWVLKGQ